ncbi:patatin-like phospholipase family protein [Oerskovia rustica]|uniref:Patatin-like phospholipase family protein n=1 Tax=Oerskovia rustica TaxID=2762237 RepID=A0ABR8RV00_9CELL|nr:patatin-like phospholipase family protein [Oerskovia rustica]MBD7951615.1 patatin-like phospholipase family protein [Oerskovia rustica]
MNTSPSSPAHSPVTPDPGPQERPAGGRAVVLGGGGSTGNAWLIGVVAGLFEAGVDVTTPDVTVGTSAGSTAAAQLAGAAPADLLAAALASTPPGRRAPEGAARRPVDDHLERMRALIASAHDQADLRRRVGAAALERESTSDGSWQERWRSTVASRLPGQTWPLLRRVLLTAVDAETGEPTVFDRDSGVDLVDAVAASCSSGLPYAIAGRRYIDGGYRRNENADLAAGYGRVLVLSPFGGRSLTPPTWGQQLATQADELRARGSEVVSIFPDADSEHLFGANAMDLSLRPTAARTGYEQGLAVADRLTEFWR